MAEAKAPKEKRAPDIVIGDFEIRIDPRNWTVSEKGKSGEVYLPSLSYVLKHIKTVMLKNKITAASENTILGIDKVYDLCKETTEEFEKITEGY